MKKKINKFIRQAIAQVSAKLAPTLANCSYYFARKAVDYSDQPKHPYGYRSPAAKMLMEIASRTHKPQLPTNPRERALAEERQKAFDTYIVKRMEIEEDYGDAPLPKDVPHAVIDWNKSPWNPENIGKLDASRVPMNKVVGVSI